MWLAQEGVRCLQAPCPGGRRGGSWQPLWLQLSPGIMCPLSSEQLPWGRGGAAWSSSGPPLPAAAGLALGMALGGSWVTPHRPAWSRGLGVGPSSQG